MSENINENSEEAVSKSLDSSQKENENEKEILFEEFSKVSMPELPSNSQVITTDR